MKIVWDQSNYTVNVCFKSDDLLRAIYRDIQRARDQLPADSLQPCYNVSEQLLDDYYYMLDDFVHETEENQKNLGAFCQRTVENLEVSGKKIREVHALLNIINNKIPLCETSTDELWEKVDFSEDLICQVLELLENVNNKISESTIDNNRIHHIET